MDEAVHVRRIQVRLFVPGGGRQDQIGIERRRVHAEVEIDDEVHLALRRLLVEFDVVYEAFGHILRDRVVMRTEIVPEEVLMALRAGQQRVPAPDEPDARPVLRRVGIFGRETQLAGFQFVHGVIHHVVVRLGASRLRVADHFAGGCD